MSQLVLGIDSSQRQLSAAVVLNGSLIASAVQEQKHTAEFLIAVVDEALEKSGHPISAVTGLAVSIGPGSFTGVRTGIATAQGIAAALAIPVLGVGTITSRLLGVCKNGETVLGTFTAFDQEVFYTAIRAELVDGACRFETVLELGVCAASEIEALREKLATDSDCAVRVVLTDDLPGAEACAFAHAAHAVDPNDPQFQVRSRGAGLEPLYGKGVQARTLAERFAASEKAAINR